MSPTAHFKYALFSNQTRATQAKRVLESSTRDVAEVISSLTGLAQNKLPLRLTRARVGATFGAVIVAASVTLAVAGLVVADLRSGPETLAPPLLSLAVLAFIAALFGALAGALSLSTEACTGVERLRETLRRSRFVPTERRPAVLLITDIESETDVEGLLDAHGAVQTGTLS